PQDIPSYIRGSAAVDRQKSLLDEETSGETLKEARNDFEREFIVKKLAEFDGNIARTAEAIGIERSHLYRKIRFYGIDV
ncbi:MAG TPA: helix-turn-helix domain-containing protein, partial [Thermodesulfobacteriota bacterium]|nr:helix-turn-helix domain-containing protein [Thermodesulfobacteriota bacterium]